jgi:ecotin
MENPSMHASHLLFGSALMTVAWSLTALGGPSDGGFDPEAVKNLEAAYPPAAAGKTRQVVLLPHKDRDEEQDFKVELIVGKTIETDGVNRYHFGGEIQERDIPGWGYSYYDAMGRFDVPAATRIAGTGEKVVRFVAGPRLVVPYNSRLPLVVMVPEGCELRWRIWRAEGEPVPAERR